MVTLFVRLYDLDCTIDVQVYWEPLERPRDTARRLDTKAQFF
jgi:hypothetical protein